MSGRVIDTHLHIFDDALSYGWANPSRFAGSLDEFGAMRAGSAIVVEAGVDAGFELDEARAVHTLASSRPWIRGFIAPLGAGFAIRDELGPFVVGYRATPRANSAMGTPALPVDLLCGRASWGAALDVLAGHPEHSVVLDHCGGDVGEPGWLTFVSAASVFPATVVKVSAGPSVDAIEQVLQLFGADRVMFGSDWPVSRDPVGQLSTLVEALGASEPELSAVLYETAERVYKLRDA